MEEKALSSLNCGGFMAKSGWNFKKAWSGKVDISCWIKAKIRPGGRLYLFIVYLDRDGKHAIPIDRCMTPSNDSILLNGRVNLTGRGDIQRMQLRIKYQNCDGDFISLEDATLKAVCAPVSASVGIREAV